MTTWGYLLGTPRKPTSVQSPTRAQDLPDNLRDVQRAINGAARLLPYTPSCLAKAFAGQRILRSRATPGEVTIGLKPDAGSSHWPAHAWLVAEGQTVTGALDEETYFPTTTYRWP